MLSDLQRTKASRFFELFDSDHDGTLEQSDLTALVDRLTALRGWTAGDAGYDDINTTWMTVWDALKGTADANSDGSVGLDEWLDVTGQMLDAPDAYEGVINAVGEKTFDLLDRDGDGGLTADDWTDFLGAHGVDADGAQASFAALDANGDGSISKDETMAALKDYFYSDSPDAPGNSFFGPT